MTTTTVADTPQSHVRPRPSDRLVTIGAVLLGLGAGAVAVLGPLVLGVIDYHVSDDLRNQIIGGDIAGLALVAPTCIAAGLLTWRHHPVGRALVLGPAFYAMYMYTQLAVGGDTARYDGNSTRFLPLFVTLFVLAGSIVYGVIQSSAHGGLRVHAGRITRAFGWFAIVVALFLAGGLHAPGLADAWRANPVGTELLADPVVFWLVKFMDLAIVVPVLIAVGVGVLRRRSNALSAAPAVASWMALLGSSVAGMAIAMQTNGDPAASPVNTIAFSVFALVALWYAVAVHRAMFRADSTSLLPSGGR